MIRIWQGWGDDWKYRGGMTWLQNRKHQSLIKDGLTPLQAREFIWYKFGLAYMRRFRNAVRRGEAGNTKTSAWALWRKYYEDAIRRKGQPGGYTPPPSRYDSTKPHKKLDSGGKVDTQYTRDYERNRRARIKGREKTSPQPSMDKEEWIRQLEESIKQTDDPLRKEQFRRQIRNLRASM